MGGVGNGAAKEDGRWDLNVGVAAVEREPRSSEWKERGSRGSDGVKREDHEVPE